MGQPNHLRMHIAAAASMVLLGACGQRSVEDQGQELIVWSKANPPVDERTWQGVNELVCRPDKASVCDAKGCRENKPVIYSKWRPAAGQYLRCDSKGCDTHNATANYSGAFATLDLPGTGMLFKVSASGEYTEVATLMHSAYVYHGQCERL